MRIFDSEFLLEQAHRSLAVARLCFAQVQRPRGVPTAFYVLLESIN